MRCYFVVATTAFFVWGVAGFSLAPIGRAGTGKLRSSEAVEFGGLRTSNGEGTGSEGSLATLTRTPGILPLNAAEYNERLAKQMNKLRIRDQSSKELSKEDLVIVYQDEQIVVVDKPSGVLSVGGKEQCPNMAQAVFDAVGADLPTAGHMIVQRLGMDTSGLMVLGRTKDAIRDLHTCFRTRKVERKYEALVAGHLARDEGTIDLPIMRDYEFPPFVRISTYDHQYALLDLEREEVHRQILEGPKPSITKYRVLAREEFRGLPVTRVEMTSVSGRYHQLNVHMATLGHPIVGDGVYGYKGEGVWNGGLTEGELTELAPNPSRADETLQAQLAKAAKDLNPMIHASYLKIRDPITRKPLEFTSEATFAIES